MGTKRFEPSSIKNKVKRQDVVQKRKRDKRQEKLQKRLARAKIEESDPSAKKVCNIMDSGAIYTIHLSPRNALQKTSQERWIIPENSTLPSLQLIQSMRPQGLLMHSQFRPASNPRTKWHWTSAMTNSHPTLKLLIQRYPQRF